MTTSPKIVGGLNAGSFRASFPFASITASPELIQIHCKGLDGFASNPIVLKPNDVNGFKKNFSWIGGGFYIFSNNPDHPKPLVFFSNPDKIEKLIKDSGFKALGTGPNDLVDELMVKSVTYVGVGLVLFYLLFAVVMMVFY